MVRNKSFLTPVLKIVDAISTKHFAMLLEFSNVLKFSRLFRLKIVNFEVGGLAQATSGSHRGHQPPWGPAFG